MRGKKAGSQAFKEIENNFAPETEHFDSEMLNAQTNLKVLTLEEKMREASKPLYLRRYE